MTIEGGENQIAWGMESARREMMENLRGGGGCKCGINKDLCFNTSSFNSWPPPATPDRNRRLGKGGGRWEEARTKRQKMKTSPNGPDWDEMKSVRGKKKKKNTASLFTNCQILSCWVFFFSQICPSDRHMCPGFRVEQSNVIIPLMCLSNRIWCN